MNDKELIIRGLDILGMPHQLWGVIGVTRTLDKFVKSWQEGEIIWNPEMPTRTLYMNVAVIKVQLVKDGQILQLKEKYREFKNSEREQRHRFDGSLAETMKNDETPYTAAVRGLNEELSQTEPKFKDPLNYRLELEYQTTREIEAFPTFPNFEIIYDRRIFTCMITSDLYHPEYVCIESDKTTYFGDWTPIK